MNPIWQTMNAVLWGKITRGFCLRCAGPDMGLMEGFLSGSFLFMAAKLSFQSLLEFTDLDHCATEVARQEQV